MAKTNADRARRWQTRARLKAFYLDEIDARRRRSLSVQFSKTTGDAEAIGLVRAFFMAFPRCFVAPSFIGKTAQGWEIAFPTGERVAVVGWEVTAAQYALVRAGYEGVHESNPGGSAIADPHYLAMAAEEVEALVTAGLWAEGSASPAQAIVRGGK